MAPMASDDTALGLTQEDLKAIDTVRARLYQLTNSIQRLKGDVMMSNLLPTPASIQASAFVLQQNMASLNEVMSQHAELFRRIVVHPDPMFPGRTEEQILTSLLRKKLEPDVEQMAERARETAAARGIGTTSFAESLAGGRASGGGGAHDADDDDDDDDEDEDEDEDEGNHNGLDDEDDENYDGPREPFGLGNIWYDARAWCMDRIGTFIREEASDVYTKQERAMGIEHVRTGLRRSLDDDDDEDDDEDDDDDDDDDDDEGEDDDVIMLDGGAEPPQQQQKQPQPAKPQPAGPPAEPERLLWLAARGDTDMPRYVEIESQRAAAAAAAQRRM